MMVSQPELCDPYLSTLSVRYYNKGAIQIHYLYSAFIAILHTQGTQVQITQFYLQITPYLYSGI